MPFSRREILRACGLSTMAGLAGCLNFGGCAKKAVFEMVQASDSEVTQRLSTPAIRIGPLGRRLVQSAIDADMTTYTACKQLLQNGVYILNEGYYQVTTTIRETKQGTRYDVEYNFSSSETTETPSAAEVITFDDLPTVDQKALLHGFLNNTLGRRGSRGDTPLGQGRGSSSICYHTDAAREASVLVPTAQYTYIKYGESIIQLAVNEPFQATSKTFQLEARRIASSPAMFTQYAYQELLGGTVNLDQKSLTQEQQNILSKSIVEGDNWESRGYETCSEDASPAFENLMQMIFATEAYQDQPVLWENEQYLANRKFQV